MALSAIAIKLLFRAEQPNLLFKAIFCLILLFQAGHMLELAFYLRGIFFGKAILSHHVAFESLTKL